MHFVCAIRKFAYDKIFITSENLFRRLQWNLTVNHVFECWAPSRTKDSNCPGITCATLFIPVLLHTPSFAYFSLTIAKYPGPSCLLHPPHLSRLFLHLFRPSKRCVILSHLTLRLCFYDGEQHPGVRFFVFHENMWVYRWLGHYASSYVLEWLWENRKIFYCFEWEWNLKIAKCFMIREI